MVEIIGSMGFLIFIVAGLGVAELTDNIIQARRRAARRAARRSLEK